MFLEKIFGQPPIDPNTRNWQRTLSWSEPGSFDPEAPSYSLTYLAGSEALAQAVADGLNADPYGGPVIITDGIEVRADLPDPDAPPAQAFAQAAKQMLRNMDRGKPPLDGLSQS